MITGDNVTNKTSCLTLNTFRNMQTASLMNEYAIRNIHKYATCNIPKYATCNIYEYGMFVTFINIQFATFMMNAQFAPEAFYQDHKRPRSTYHKINTPLLCGRTLHKKSPQITKRSGNTERNRWCSWPTWENDVRSILHCLSLVLTRENFDYGHLIHCNKN